MFYDEISGKSTTGVKDPMDRAQDGGIGTHLGDVTYIPPSTHRPASSTISLVTMASNLMLKSHKDLSLGSSRGA
jgi:hypothetical protein